jgi:hypothetical protein
MKEKMSSFGCSKTIINTQAQMEKIIRFSIIISCVIVSGCATIVGGSKYNAHVIINNKPNAKIFYQGEMKGYGDATFKVSRKKANEFSVTVEEGYFAKETFDYRSRKIRGGALVGTILGWTATIGVIPFPGGLLLDFATGALWKPNVKEKGVTKLDYKNFKYLIEYRTSSMKETDVQEPMLITPTIWSRYYGNDGTSSKNHSYKIVLQNGVVINKLTNIEWSDSGCFIKVKKDDEEMLLKPSDTKEVSYTTEEGKEYIGIPVNNCWLFKMNNKGEIAVYTYLPENMYKYAVAIRKGENGNIVAYTRVNILKMVSNDETSLRYIDKNDLWKAISSYNKVHSGK